MEKKKNNDLKNMLIGFGVIFFYVFASSMVQDIFNLFNINIEKMSNLNKQIILTLYESTIALIIIYIYRRDFIPNLKGYLKNIKFYLKKYIIYWPIALLLMVISNMIIINFTTADVATNQSLIEDSFKVAPIYILITTVIVAPIMEELVFRLTFRKIFAHTDFLFILFSGLIFGMMHVVNYVYDITDLLFIIPYSIPGFIFAYTLKKSDNIMVPISLHIIHNTFQVLLLLI